jgi:hypothetical protein
MSPREAHVNAELRREAREAKQRRRADRIAARRERKRKRDELITTAQEEST